MPQSSASPLLPAIVYPERDGKPMSDNTKQARWIAMLYGNLCALYRDRPDVFVAADNLWYPIESEPEIRQAPDVYVVFGRPKGDRGSYVQWKEDNIPLTVVFKILSPGNDALEMEDKRAFYEEYGVEEYYLYDPDSNRLAAFVRRGEVFRRIRPIEGHISPRLGIRFDPTTRPEMTIYRSDGRRFLTFEELEEERLQLWQRADKAEQRADNAEQQLVRLRELSRKARRGQANEAELQELDRLEEEPSP